MESCVAMRCGGCGKGGDDALQGEGATAVFIGDIHRIDTTTSTFANLIEQGSLYVDKTAFIEHFINNPSRVQVVCRQRRLGKSLNLDMLRCFLTDAEDCRALAARIAQ